MWETGVEGWHDQTLDQRKLHAEASLFSECCFRLRVGQSSGAWRRKATWLKPGQVELAGIFVQIGDWRQRVQPLIYEIKNKKQSKTRIWTTYVLW